MPIDIVVIAGAGAHAQKPILPDLDQPLRGCVQADHQRLLQRLELMRNRDARHQRHVRGANASVGEIDRGGRLGRTRYADQNHLGFFQPFNMLTIVMHHRVIQGVDALEIFRIQYVLGADAAGGGGTQIGLEQLHHRADDRQARNVDVPAFGL